MSNETVVLPQAAPKPRSSIRMRLRQHPGTSIGLVILVAMVTLSLVAPFIATDPSAQNISERHRPPGRDYLFGSDDYGRDILSRVLYGGRTSFAVGAAVTLLAVSIGTFAGLLTGYFRWLDPIIMRIADGLMAFPSILLAIALSYVMGRGIPTVVVALSVAYLPRVVRIVRGSVLVVREMDFIEAARATGSGAPRILFKHILPNIMGIVLVQVSFIFSAAVLGEAALSFLGVGVPPDIPSWGAIVNDGRNLFSLKPWLGGFAGLAITLTILALNLTGDGLRDMLDPRLRRVK